MLSDKHNSKTAKAMGLIFVLFYVASTRDVPFRKSQQLQCLHHGSTEAFFCSPLFSIPFLHCCIGDDFWYTCYGFGVRLGLVQS